MGWLYVDPSDESLGYCRSSLRDFYSFYSRSFRRCSWTIASPDSSTRFVPRRSWAGFTATRSSKAICDLTPRISRRMPGSSSASGGRGVRWAWEASRWVSTRRSRWRRKSSSANTSKRICSTTRATWIAFSQWSVLPQPGGRKRIAQRFNAGISEDRENSPVRDGRTCAGSRKVSFAPAGLVSFDNLLSHR